MKRVTGFLIAGLAASALDAGAAAQRWEETCGRSVSGGVAQEQALLDIGRDSLVLLVASHPDDRYVLPAAWLRYCHGVRVAVLLATRGGGGQNSAGPETGDALERIRTLESEAGCARFDADVHYLNRPDAGYRRTAAETFAEWGRETTLAELVRHLRAIRPDVVMTTHHAEEAHGHDQALVELLPEAVRLAADADFSPRQPAHAVAGLYLGSVRSDDPRALRIPSDRWEPVRGATLRRLAYEALQQAHTSPGALAPPETLFEAELRFLPHEAGASTEAGFLAALPTIFDAAAWPGPGVRRAELDRLLTSELPSRVRRGDDSAAIIVAALGELRAVRAGLPPGAVAARERLGRRIEAIERLLLLVSRVQLELEIEPGAHAVAGEDTAATLFVHRGAALPLGLRVEGLAGIRVTTEAMDDQDLAQAAVGRSQLRLSMRVPAGLVEEPDPMARRFRADRFVPPVRIRCFVTVHGAEVPVDLVAPLEQRPPLGLELVPPRLLLPSGRVTAKFSVRVTRNSRHPIGGALEVDAPAGYVIDEERREVSLRELRGDLFGFTLRSTGTRTTGVDSLRVRLGNMRVVLPVHRVDVQVSDALRIGLLRNRDDTLPGILGAGGLGIAWSELSDADIAVADLDGFDTIVVDVRALKDRPEARRGFRRLLEFAALPARRLVVFYHKDVEFHPAGEGFLGAPFAPFQIGRARVTRPDAAVRLLRPDHVLLRQPNTIRLSDWDGWEQERALYLPVVYSNHYEEVLEMNDPGQGPERGALLYARAGSGEFVHCSLALWRQLKKLHPGAVRLLANLLTPTRSG